MGSHRGWWKGQRAIKPLHWKEGSHTDTHTRACADTHTHTHTHTRRHTQTHADTHTDTHTCYSCALYARVFARAITAPRAPGTRDAEAGAAQRDDHHDNDYGADNGLGQGRAALLLKRLQRIADTCSAVAASHPNTALAASISACMLIIFVSDRFGFIWRHEWERLGWRKSEGSCAHSRVVLILRAFIFAKQDKRVLRHGERVFLGQVCAWPHRTRCCKRMKE